MKRIAWTLLILLLCVPAAQADPVLAAHAEIGSSSWAGILGGVSVGLEHDNIGGVVTVAAGEDVSRLEAALYVSGSGRAVPYAGAGVALETGPDRAVVRPVYENPSSRKPDGFVFDSVTDRATRLTLFVGIRRPSGLGPFAEARALLGTDPSVALRIGVRL